MSQQKNISEEYQQSVNIPIPVFPPFKLRSSLIDKDPVIWEYLLADYITLFKKLLALVPYSSPKNKRLNIPPPIVLTTNTLNQLHTFLQSFLHESSLESTQIFSLGAVNPNIRENQHILKLAVFSYIKETNLVNLKLTGSSIWEFCKVYVTMADKYSNKKINQGLITIPTIRKLIQGTVKSSYTSKSDDVSLIRSLQDHLSKLIASGKWKNDDSEILYLLLGQRTKKGVIATNNNNDTRRNTSNNNNNKKFKNVKVANNNDNSGSEFAENFVNKHWIEILEELYVGGRGVNAKVCLQIMVLSFCSLTSAKILKLLKEQLEIDNFNRLKQFNPLVSCVVLSKKFNEMNPDLKDLLSPILVSKSVVPTTKSHEKVSKVFDEEKISNLIDMFPQLTSGQAKTLLDKNEDNVEKSINSVLEMDVDNISTIEDYDEVIKEKERKEAERKNKKKKPKNVVEFEMEKDKVYTVQMGKKQMDESFDDVDSDLRKKNLERALALLYDADEDEPDDTYIDNEGKSVATLGSMDDEVDGIDLTSRSTDATSSNTSNSKLDKQLLEIEAKLFAIYSSTPDKLRRTDRNSQYRQELRRETGWTDEQIEGWARVIEKSPKRFRMLEERLVYVDGSLNKSGKKSTKWSAPKKVSDDDGDIMNRHSRDKRKGGKLFTPAKTDSTQSKNTSQKSANKPANKSSNKSSNKPSTGDSSSSPSSKNNSNFRYYMDKKKKKMEEKKKG